MEPPLDLDEASSSEIIFMLRIVLVQLGILKTTTCSEKWKLKEG